MQDKCSPSKIKMKTRGVSLTLTAAQLYDAVVGNRCSGCGVDEGKK
jgi:hypothetical protein